MISQATMETFLKKECQHLEANILAMVVGDNTKQIANEVFDTTSFNEESNPPIGKFKLDSCIRFFDSL